MLYVQVDKKRWDDIPSGWDEVRDMFQYLHKMTYAHQLNFEARMFALQSAAEYRCTLIRWDSEGVTRGKKRTVLLETTDPRQMKAALLMLISEAEPEYKAAKMQWVSHEL